MQRLIQSLSKLPGIGKRSAERIAFHMLKQPEQEANALASAIMDLKRNVRHCAICFNLTESDPCAICTDPQRDKSLVLVVEQPADVVTFESTGMFNGVYHVLMGRLSPLDGIGPGELNIASLMQRVAPKPGQVAVREVVLGTSPNLEGDGTAMYLSQELGARGVHVTRLARGLPTGSSLEMTSKAVLNDALAGRQAM